MEKVLITGASGFVGKNLSLFFLSRGDMVTGLGTSGTHPFSDTYENFSWISADTTIAGDWQRAVSESDIVINLAGRNIFRFWTKKYKKAIYDSRILTTRNIVDALEKGKQRKILSASAVGIYGDQGSVMLDETSLYGDSFLSNVCVDWEKEALKAAEKEIQVCIMRLGVVLGREGALAKMIPAFKMFAGGPLGSGEQWFPWIHIEDLVQAVSLLADNKDSEGVFNFTSPNPLKQKDFARSLGRILKRPAIVPAPAFIVKLIMGELGAAFLESQRAVPEKLKQSGFRFEFEDLDVALADIRNNIF